MITTKTPNTQKRVLNERLKHKEEGAEEHVPGTECNLDKYLLAQSEGRVRRWKQRIPE